MPWKRFDNYTFKLRLAACDDLVCEFKTITNLVWRSTSIVSASIQKSTSAKKIKYLAENQVIGLNRNGQVHESQVACQSLKSIGIFQSNMIADKACETMKIRNYIEGEASAYTISNEENYQEQVGLWLSHLL